MPGHLGSILCLRSGTFPWHHQPTSKMDICVWILFSGGTPSTHSRCLINCCRITEQMPQKDGTGPLSLVLPKGLGPFPIMPQDMPLRIGCSSHTSRWPFNKRGRESCGGRFDPDDVPWEWRTNNRPSSFLPSEEGLWMARWQLPDVISWEVSGLSIYCSAWNDGYYCYKYYHAGEAGLQAQTAALFTNIINEVIFNINSPATAFLKTVYGLGHRAICNFYGTSMTGLPPRLISFGRGLVYFMNDKNKPLLAADEGWFMSSKPRPSER